MNFKRKFIIAVSALMLASSMLFAQLTDHDQWSPGNSKDWHNLFIGIDGRAGIPPVFISDGPDLSGWGPGVGFEFGYDFNGWLFSLHYTHQQYESRSGDLFGDFQHNLVRLDVSKIFTKYHLKFLPDWLNLRWMVSIGMDRLDVAYSDGTTGKSDEGLSLGTGLFVEYPGWQNFTPYLGMNFDFLYNNAGLAVPSDGMIFMPAITFGIRTTFGASGGNVTKPVAAPSTPGLALGISGSPMTGDYRKINKATITPSITVPEGDEVESWKVDIMSNSGKRVYKSYSGTGKMPSKLEFDGIADDGERVQSFEKHAVRATATTKGGRTYTDEGLIETGIIIAKSADGSLRFDAKDIVFDPNAATFNTLTPDQIKYNNVVFNAVVEQLKKYKTFNIEIQGHANPTTPAGTPQREREEQNDLIPLSDARAKAVRQILIDRGIAASRLTASGKGGQYATATGDEAWRNRRVEFILKK